jgi:hypothetical protein
MLVKRIRKLYGIDPESWEHPADKAALSVLKLSAQRCQTPFLAGTRSFVCLGALAIRPWRSNILLAFTR